MGTPGLALGTAGPVLGTPGSVQRTKERLRGPRDLPL